MVMTGPAPSPPGGRQLRVALAMRGGVSLAVWIGGAIAELDLARRGSLRDKTVPADDRGRRAEAYGNLLRELGYDELRFDVLAGASAGGLNAVIYGFTQSLGIDLEWLSDVWKAQGDLWGLFHPQWGSARGERFGTAAVLRGDQAFYQEVLEEMDRRERLAAASGPPPDRTSIDDYLTIDLSATLLAGPPLPDRAGADIRPRTAHFRFRRTPAGSGPFNDIAIGSADPQVLRRLAYAARSTGSFPGAFEPATVRSWRRPGGRTTETRRCSGDGDRPANMVDVFSEVGCARGSAFDVMDGGVFDNIPIGRAVQAIADSPAAGRTQRVLVYLDPSPPRTTPAAPPRPVVRRPHRPAFLLAAVTALRDQLNTESATDDIREIGRLRAAADDIQARRRAFLAGLPHSLRAVEENALSAAYADYRATSDASRVADLLMAPGVGFLRALIPNPPVACAVGPDEASAVRAELESRLRPGGPDPRLPADGTALVAAATLLIAWVQLAQDAHRRSDGFDAAKGALYRARTVGQYAAQRSDRDAALVLLGDPDTPIDAAAIGRMTQALRPGRRGCRVSRPIVLGTEEQLWERMSQAQEHPDGVPDALLASGWATLCHAFDRLDPADPAADAIFRTLARPGRSTVLDTRRVRLVTMAASVSVGTLTTTAVPRFFTFSGDEPPADDDLAELRLQARADAVDDAEDRHSGGPRAQPAGPRPDARSKLAGNQLFNFAGFLSEEWREHDFAWGRADAGAALLRMLGDLQPQQARGPAFEQAHAQVRDLCRPLNHRKLHLSDLGPGRLFAMVTRLSLGLPRALWPSTDSIGAGADRQVFRAGQVLGVAALILVRPLLMLLPLLVRPWVLLGVAGALAGADHVRRPPPSPPPGSTPGLSSGALTVAIVMLVLAVGALSALRTAGRRWGELHPEAGAAGSPSGVGSGRLRMPGAVDATRVAAGLLIVGAAGLGYAAVGSAWPPIHRLVEQATGFDALVVLSAALGVFLVARGFTATRLLALSSAPAGPDVPGLIGAAAGVVVWVAGWWLGDADPTVDRLAAAASALAAAALLWAIHHAWADAGWPALIALTAAAGVAVLDARAIEISAAWPLLYPVEIVGGVLVVLGTLRLTATPSRLLAGRSRTADRVRMVITVAGLVLVVAETVAGTWLLLAQWGWLGGGPIPPPLLVGAVTAAATTAIVPFRDALAGRPASGPGAPSGQSAR